MILHHTVQFFNESPDGLKMAVGNGTVDHACYTLSYLLPNTGRASREGGDPAMFVAARLRHTNGESRATSRPEFPTTHQSSVAHYLTISGTSPDRSTVHCYPPREMWETDIAGKEKLRW